MSKENNTIELTDLTVASVQGEDAKDFLQGQLSQDLSLVNDKTATLAAYCTAKGRVLATMVVLQNPHDDGYLLLTKADNAMAFIQRLRMFVLRAKVDIQITNTKVYGAINLPLENKDNFFINHTFAVKTQNDGDDEIIYISAPSSDENLNRYWVLSQQELLSDNYLASNNTDTDIKLDSIEQWQSQDIKAGLPWVVAANQDVYIPQTLNFDLINGVSFTKGCYPGQEVVARSHYRGTIKRRCVYAVADLAQHDLDKNNDLVGSDVFNADKPKNPCGRVINAVVHADKIFLLIEAQLSDIDNADFRLQNSQGIKITLNDMPYSILENN